MSERILDSDLRRIQLEVVESTSEEELLERFRQAKATFAEQRRQRILESAASIVSSYSTHYGAACIQTPPTLHELRARLERLPPSVVETRLHEMRDDLSDYDRFEELFDKKMEERIPGNWIYFWASREEAKAAKKQEYRDQLETVQKARVYMNEMVDLAERVLRDKQLFIRAHEAEVPRLVRECVELTRQASDVKERADRIVGKLQRSTLNERDRAKIAEQVIDLIRRHRQLEAQLGPKTNLLNEYQPEACAEWRGKVAGFPSSRYSLPGWLDLRVQRALSQT